MSEEKKPTSVKVAEFTIYGCAILAGLLFLGFIVYSLVTQFVATMIAFGVIGLIGFLIWCVVILDDWEHNSYR